MNIWSKTKRSWISLLHHSYLLIRKNKYISNNEKNSIWKTLVFLWQQMVSKIEDRVNCISSALSKDVKQINQFCFNTKNKPSGYKFTDFLLRCTYSKKNSSLPAKLDFYFNDYDCSYYFSPPEFIMFIDFFTFFEVLEMNMLKKKKYCFCWKRHNKWFDDFVY